MYGYMDIWIYGHRIKKMIFGLEVDIEYKMGDLDPGLFLTRTELGPRHPDPGTLTWGPTRGPGPGDPDPGTRTQGPGPGSLHTLHGRVQIKGLHKEGK